MNAIGAELTANVTRLLPASVPQPIRVRMYRSQINGLATSESLVDSEMLRFAPCEVRPMACVFWATPDGPAGQREGRARCAIRAAAREAGRGAKSSGDSCAAVLNARAS